MTTMTTTTTTRDWRVVVRKPRANRFQPVIFAGTWEEASRLADALSILTDLEVWYTHKDDATVLTHTGRQVEIRGRMVNVEELLTDDHSHSLDLIEGYKVRIDAGKYATTVFYNPTEYALAVAKADEARSRGRQATVSRLYSCGHWSEDLDRYYTGRAS